MKSSTQLLRTGPECTVGADSVGCEYTGTITPINSNVNVYDAVVTVSNCSDGGKYRGIGTLIDSVFSDGTLNPNSAFVFSGTNGVNYRTDVLFKLE